jgi:EAL domain-containing protein (putative c-di-GMP-specific phosphodiesterase class I)/CheY-like chemotaxis protein
MAKILLVDDVPEQVMAYRRLLRGHFDVVTAGDGAAALDLLKRDADIEVIVSDMSMPCMNGIDFFVQAAEVAPGAARIMLSGNTDMNATIDAINRGQVLRYLKKPCQREDLIEAIEAGLRLRSQESRGDAPDRTSDGLDLAANQMHMIDRLRRALRDNRLQAFFQPIVDLETGSIRGAEALARWRHPVDGWIPPSVFIPIAERCGLMPELGRAMLMAACRDARNWHLHGFDGWVSVNASVTQFVDGNMIADVRHALDESGLPPGNLTIELTESVLIHDPTSVIETLEQLRVLGVKLAIDDFGTGYSSLAYLKYLPIDRLKIDRCFIEAIDRDERDLAFVRAMLDLASKLDLTVVAEGIERAEQHHILRDLGCAFGQGYLFEKALDANSFATLIAVGTIDPRYPTKTGTC